jgi:hypothetical protein
VARFYGWRVVGGAFVLAFLGWGLGFYGPPVYLQAVREARGFSLTIVSSAVTVHFLAGAVLAANIPALYRRFGLPLVTSFTAVALSAGVFGCHRGRAMATLHRRGRKRRGLGRDERRCGQCRRVAVVFAHAARGARHGL